MGGELDGRANGADDAEASVPGPAAAPRRTPDESTLLLPAPAGAGPESNAESDALASAQEGDVPRLSPGESLAGRFTILRFIAQGGMGAVYEANDTMLRSHVALKVIRGRIATDATALERFRREVLLARRVSHPNVCRVYELYDGTTAAGVPVHFLTMELLEGQTLSERIRRQGRLTTGEAFPLVQQLCWGLAAAHSEGVIHRDFKSSNVLLVPRREGSKDSTAPSIRAVITDFGIARAVQGSNSETNSEQLTGGANILGTPEYMAPEQVTGGAVTEATDIYSLGIVLYEMVTGTLPFTGDTPLVAAAKRLNEAPPRPEVTAPGLDPRWSKALLRCLSREPERRFQNARDILPGLERPARRWPRWASTSALVLALALAGTAAVRFLAKPHPLEPRATPAAPRPVLAILGFRDELASPELAWLPTAVSEVLGHELAAAETSLRVIPQDRVAQVRRSLGVSDQAVMDDKARERMQGLLSANVLLYGTLKPTVPAATSVGLTVHMVDAVSGHELASLEEDLGEGASALVEKVSVAAQSLLQTLGVSLTQEQAAALSASRPRNLAAARLYAQGVLRLWKFEYQDARSAFDAALATDGGFLDAQRRVVQTWEGEGNRKKAHEAAERIRARPSGLTTRQRAEIEAKALSLGPEPAKGIEALQALFDATPDDVELAMVLLDQTSPETGKAIISRLRELPAPASGDIRFDGEAAARLLDDSKAFQELQARVKARAQALGARSEIAGTLWSQAMAFEFTGRQAEAAPMFQEAASLYEETGELPWAAFMKMSRAGVLSAMSLTSEGLKAYEETAALYRRLGDRAKLRDTFVAEADLMQVPGDFELAEAKFREAISEAEALSETPGFSYEMSRGWLALHQADLEGVRTALRAMRAEPAWQLALGNEPGINRLEALVLAKQDRLTEARALYLGRGTLAELTPFLRGEFCELACDEGHPLQGLECVAKYPPPAGLGTNLTLAKCRYAAGDLKGAESAAVAAQAEAQQKGEYSGGVRARSYILRIRAARGETAKAIAGLRAELAEAERKKAFDLAFDVALELGEVELRAGHAEGRARLVKLEQEARSKQLLLVARLAREALDRKPPAATSKPAQ
jgi:tRNA A-37 threonylcarbamoyl transferase component Bud32